MQGLSHIIRDNFMAGNRELIEHVREAAEKQQITRAISLLRDKGLKGRITCRIEIDVVTERHYVSIHRASSTKEFR